jgi:methylamine---corrinoid protein Co-methyltransferase
MKHRGRLLEVLRRAETGPMIDEKDFEGKLITTTVKRLIDKYSINYDRVTIVSHDDDLADRVFQAGLEFAVEIGMYCQNTNRRIMWTRKEYEDALRYSPNQATMGMGNDSITIKARRPEDTLLPTFIGGSFGVPVPEDLFVPFLLSYLREPLINVVENPTIDKVYGYPIKADSPWEVLAGWRETELARMAANQAGRSGIAIGGIEISTSALAQISAASYDGLRPSDWHHVSAPSEFKTNYDLLSKVAHINRINANMEAYLNIIYGGYLGGPEGVAIGLVAGLIVLNQNYMGTTLSVSSAHPFIHSDALPPLLWAQSLAFQAISRNTHLLVASLCKPISGPGTKTLLYECAAFIMAGVVSGLSVPQAAMTAGGVNPRHASGLESKFSGEVAHAVAGMKRHQADDIIKQIVPKYEPMLKYRPIGLPFEEVYDVSTVTPKPFWQDMVDDVKEDLIRLGVSFC